MSAVGQSAATDRSLRSVFVGNIPYEATEEQLKDIFSEVGPVVSFRLVYDRETGKPKGYGFCEYKDQETALSAMRNLSGYELNGRQLRVDNAASEKNKEELKILQASGPPVESPFGEPCSPDEAPTAISKAVASLPPEQMYELMKQMKMVIQNNPVEARNMLLQNPQLAYALLQAQVVMRIVSPEIAMAMLHKPQTQAPPLETGGPGPAPGQPIMQNPNMVGPGSNQGMPVNSSAPMQPQGPQPLMAIPQPAPQQQPQGPMNSGGAMLSGQLLGPDPRMSMTGSQGQPMVGGQGQPMVGGQGQPMVGGQGQPMGGGQGPSMPGPPMGMQQQQQPRQPPPAQLRGGLLGDTPLDPRPQQDPRGRPDPRQVDPRGGPGPRGPGGPPQRGPVPGGPRMSQAPPGLNIPGFSPSGGGSPSQNITAQDQEKAALIMQVLQLTPEQVAMLPPDQRQSIMILKEQIARSTGHP
ncbi:cleavage stimulation factor subunit 2-like [Saccoglossus kowalevskii]|uniref:Cleavage stimulation factor subunit 2-like n=1 Tax=Saccoglossus kowalevskii TaxID=10224 RepID=A0ABM0M7R6_SACKO|nr:PREDICTED: cleavage stimulation factor subunit 2-like [Saccoglossus kowalevskii]